MISNGDFLCGCPNGESDIHNFPSIKLDIGTAILTWESEWYMSYYPIYMGFSR